MSTHNIDFYEDLTKILFELSSNMHLISSADDPKFSDKVLAKNAKPVHTVYKRAVTDQGLHC